MIVDSRYDVKLKIAYSRSYKTEVKVVRGASFTSRFKARYQHIYPYIRKLFLH